MAHAIASPSSDTYYSVQSVKTPPSPLLLAVRARATRWDPKVSSWAAGRRGKGLRCSALLNTESDPIAFRGSRFGCPLLHRVGPDSHMTLQTTNTYLQSQIGIVHNLGSGISGSRSRCRLDDDVGRVARIGHHPRSAPHRPQTPGKSPGRAGCEIGPCRPRGGRVRSHASGHPHPFSSA